MVEPAPGRGPGGLSPQAVAVIAVVGLVLAIVALLILLV